MDYNQKIIGQGLTYDDVLLVPIILIFYHKLMLHLFFKEYQTKHSYCFNNYESDTEAKWLFYSQDGGIEFFTKTCL